MASYDYCPCNFWITLSWLYWEWNQTSGIFKDVAPCGMWGIHYGTGAETGLRREFQWYPIIHSHTFCTVVVSIRRGQPTSVIAGRTLNISLEGFVSLIYHFWKICLFIWSDNCSKGSQEWLVYLMSVQRPPRYICMRSIMTRLWARYGPHLYQMVERISFLAKGNCVFIGFTGLPNVHGWWHTGEQMECEASVSSGCGEMFV